MCHAARPLWDGWSLNASVCRLAMCFRLCQLVPNPLFNVNTLIIIIIRWYVIGRGYFNLYRMSSGCAEYQRGIALWFQALFFITNFLCKGAKCQITGNHLVLLLINVQIYVINRLLINFPWLICANLKSHGEFLEKRFAISNIHFLRGLLKLNWRKLAIAWTKVSVNQNDRFDKPRKKHDSSKLFKIQMRILDKAPYFQIIESWWKVTNLSQKRHL